MDEGLTPREMERGKMGTIKKGGEKRREGGKKGFLALFVG